MEEIGKNDVDVLILDLIMPHLDGIGVLEALNSMELKKYPRVVMVSAVGQDSMISARWSNWAQSIIWSNRSIRKCLPKEFGR